jgi:large subunit ribosomal protein L4
MGPVQHSHAFDLPKKVRALGLRHALSAKAKDGALIVIESAKVDAIKTRELAKRLDKIGAQNALIVDGQFDGNFALSARNLAGVGLLPTAGLNVYDILRRDKLVLTTAAVKAIEERLS